MGPVVSPVSSTLRAPSWSLLFEASVAALIAVQSVLVHRLAKIIYLTAMFSYDLVLNAFQDRRVARCQPLGVTLESQAAP